MLRHWQDLCTVVVQFHRHLLVALYLHLLHPPAVQQFLIPVRVQFPRRLPHSATTTMDLALQRINSSALLKVPTLSATMANGLSLLAHLAPRALAQQMVNLSTAALRQQQQPPTPLGRLVAQARAFPIQTSTVSHVLFIPLWLPNFSLIMFRVTERRSGL